jgi:hypothetical protein
VRVRAPREQVAEGDDEHQRARLAREERHDGVRGDDGRRERSAAVDAECKHARGGAGDEGERVAQRGAAQRVERGAQQRRREEDEHEADGASGDAG